jgi:hypothetical protein
MKLIYSGNIEGLSSLVNRINNKQKFQFFPNNEITSARLKGIRFEIAGIFCKGVGQLNQQNKNLTIDLKVRLRRPFVFFGIFALIILSGFILVEHVTIDSVPNPSVWGRTIFVSVGLIFFFIHILILRKLRNDFERKITDLLK